MKRARVVWLMLLISCACGAVRAQVGTPSGQATDGLVEEYRKGVRTQRLPSGLVLVTKENHAAQVASVYVIVRAGSLLEQEYLGAGISHLTEHLVAGGSTANRTEQQIQTALDDTGAISNAFTSMDRTAYYVNTTSDHVATAIDLLADFVQHAKIDPAEFDREFGVVQREILTGEGDVRRQAATLLSEAMFPNMPQGLAVIGYYKNIQALTRDDVCTYYKRMYVPSNAVVCAAGDFDGAAVMGQLEKAFGEWDGPRVRPAVLPEPAPPVADIVVVKEMDTRLAQVHVARLSCRLSDPDLYALDVLAAVLGRGDSSRLAADLKVKRSLVYSISCWNYTPSWPGGEFAVSFTCDPDKVDVVRQAVAEHLARACAESPAEDELEKVKRQLVAELLLDTRTAAAQARDLATNQLSLGDPFFSARYVEEFQKVTAADVLRVARKYLANTRSVTAVVRPKGAPSDTVASAGAAAKPATTRIIFPDSGLTLLVHRMPGQPAVSMAAAMKAGLSIETESTAGISALAARYLERGTATRSEEEIARFFDSIGGSIDTGSGWNSVYVRALALEEQFEQAFDVFCDVLMHPAFPPDLLDSTRQRQLASLKSMQANPWGEAALYFAEQFFPDSPYRFPEVGTEKTVAGMAVEDVRGFYNRVRVGRNMVLAVAGDVDPAAVEALVRARFAELTAGDPVEAPAGVKPRSVEHTEIYVKKTDKPAATVFVGYPGVDLYNLRDRAAMDVFETICAGYGMPRGWLHDVLRGRSLVYAVHFSGRAGLLPGYYRSQAQCQPDKVTLVARLLRDLVHSGRQYAYTDDDLRRAKAIILSERRFRRQTPEQIGLQMTLDELYGLGYAFEEAYDERVKAVAVDDVRRVVAAYITAPVICLATPEPGLVDMEELRRPYDAEKLKAMREAMPPAPEDAGRRRSHTPPQ